MLSHYCAVLWNALVHPISPLTIHIHQHPISSSLHRVVEHFQVAEYCGYSICLVQACCAVAGVCQYRCFLHYGWTSNRFFNPVLVVQQETRTLFSRATSEPECFSLCLHRPQCCSGGLDGRFLDIFISQQRSLIPVALDMPYHRRKPAVATWSSPPPSLTKKTCCCPELRGLMGFVEGKGRGGRGKQDKGRKWRRVMRRKMTGMRRGVDGGHHTAW